METLLRLLLVVATATSLTIGLTESTAHAAPKPPPISYQEAVVENLTNSAGGTVVYRRGWHAGGGTGFGYDKISRKHNINNVQVVRAVVRYPQVIRQETQTRWVHEKQALLMGLGGVSQTLMVRVVIEYGGWAGPGQHGVVTAYCVGIQGRCPDWVNRAFAID
jgi:hypothetical protein